MKTPITFVALLVFMQGCASAPEGHTPAPHSATVDTQAPIVLRAEPTFGLRAGALVHGSEVERNEQAPVIEGRPLTAVVVTQCNLVVAVYMTMPDGRLVRFDQRAEVPAQELVAIAYTAVSSERVEVACDALGAAAFEKHGSI